MDMIYREARSVIVALDDVEINPDEEMFLQDYLRSYNGLELFDDNRRIPQLRGMPSHIHTKSVCISLHKKTSGSRWVPRAWCAHDMRMGKRHVSCVSFIR